MGQADAGSGHGHVCFPGEDTVSGNVSLFMGMTKQREKKSLGCGVLFIRIVWSATMKTSLATNLFPCGKGYVFTGGREGGKNVRVKGNGAQNF